jgi:tetratricopeptide (TPR) repeat protein
MISLLRITLSLSVAGAAFAQVPGLTLPPSGNNQKASVTQFIGPVRVTIDYSSPAVKDRRGQIWGKLVPYGLTNLGFGNGKPGPWRAGANENTVFTVSHDVAIEGKPLHAGHYGLHMIPGPDEWTLILSRNASAWGSFFYEESEDALRVQLKPHKHDYQEYLAYEFTARHPSDATVELQWEELAVPWTIKIDNIEDIYVSRLQHELTTVPGFDYRGYVAAARYCAQSGKHLDQGLKWADAAISMPNIGEKNFDTLSTKALVLVKMGNGADSKTLMDSAVRLPQTTPAQIHQYGRQLLGLKKPDEAMEVFKYNAERNGDTWPVHVGLARGYAALGDNKQALEHAQKALTQAPDDLNRQGLAAMVKTLQEGKSVTQ